MIRSISLDEFDTLTRPLLGLPVSRAWTGYGSAIFLELGELSDLERPDGKSMQIGEAAIMIEWDWRIEGSRSIVVGSSSTFQQIASGLSTMEGSTLTALSVSGRLPELSAEFSNGMILRTFMTDEGEPQWIVRMPDGSGIHSADREIRLTDWSEPEPETTAEEELELGHSEASAKRWSAVVPAPHIFGSCRDCAYFRHIEGEAWFHDYGICTNVMSSYDGRVVEVSSGCSAFSTTLLSHN